MSLLLPIKGMIAADAGTDVAQATRRLCAELLRHNRLPPAAVVAARFVADPQLAASPVPVARAEGWRGIPLFFSRAAAPTGRLEVEAWVRLKRRRKLRPLEVEPAPAEGDGVHAAAAAASSEDRPAGADGALRPHEVLA